MVRGAAGPRLGSRRWSVSAATRGWDGSGAWSAAWERRREVGHYPQREGLLGSAWEWPVTVGQRQGDVLIRERCGPVGLGCANCGSSRSQGRRSRSKAVCVRNVAGIGRWHTTTRAFAQVRGTGALHGRRRSRTLRIALRRGSQRRCLGCGRRRAAAHNGGGGRGQVSQPAVETSAKPSSPCSAATTSLPVLRRARRRVFRPRQAMSVAPREMASDLPGWVSGTHRVLETMTSMTWPYWSTAR